MRCIEPSLIVKASKIIALPPTVEIFMKSRSKRSHTSNQNWSMTNARMLFLEQLERRDVPNAAFDLIGLTVLRATPEYSFVDGSGISVAVIDSGVDYTHPLLAPAVARDTNNQLVGRDFADESGIAVVTKSNNKAIDFKTTDNIPDDQVGHGTHVAGIIAARRSDIGVAQSANLIGLKVADRFGDISVVKVQSALQWVHENAKLYNIKVVNMSLGAGGYKTPSGADPYGEMIRQLELDGVTVVSAAGNDYGEYAFNQNDQPEERRNSATPAVSSTLAVGATFAEAYNTPIQWGVTTTLQLVEDRTAQPGGLASFSQRPAAVAGGINGTAGNGIFAPGTFITSTSLLRPDPASETTQALSGTSFAAPIISGVVALMQDAAMGYLGRYLSTTEVRNIILDSATTIRDDRDFNDGARENGSVLPTNAFYKMVNANAAITLIRTLSGAGSPSDPNATIATAELLAPFSKVLPIIVDRNLGSDGTAGTSNPGGLDVDMYRVTVPVAGTLSISTGRVPDATADLDTFVRLFDANGNPLASNNDRSQGQVFASLSFNVNAGNYYVGVSGNPNSSYDPNIAFSGVATAQGGNYRLTLALVSSDPNGVIGGAVRVYPSLGQLSRVEEFLGGDFLVNRPGMDPRTVGVNAVDLTLGGFVVDTVTTSSPLEDVDLYILTAPTDGVAYIDIDSGEFLDAGAAANTFVRAWPVLPNGQVDFANPLFDAGLSFNDAGFNPYQPFNIDVSQNSSFDPFFRVPVVANQSIVFGVSGPVHTNYNPNTASGRQAASATTPGFYLANFGIVSSDRDGRIGTDAYNLDSSLNRQLPVDATFKIGSDLNNGTETAVGNYDVDIYQFTASSNGSLEVTSTGMVANGITFDSMLSIFEVRAVAGSQIPGTNQTVRQTLKLLELDDVAGQTTNVNPTIKISVQAGTRYYIAVTSAGNNNFDPYVLASGLPGNLGSYRLTSSFTPGGVALVPTRPIEVGTGGTQTFFSAGAGQARSDIVVADTGIIRINDSDGNPLVGTFNITITRTTSQSEINSVANKAIYVVFARPINTFSEPTFVSISNNDGVVSFRRKSTNDYFIVSIVANRDYTQANYPLRWDTAKGSFVLTDEKAALPTQKFSFKTTRSPQAIPEIKVGISNPVITEGSTIASTVTFTRNVTTNELPIAVELSGATRGLDYTITGFPTGNPRVYFGPGSSTFTLTILALGDLLDENTEYVDISLVSQLDNSIHEYELIDSSASCAITNVAPPPPPPPPAPTITFQSSKFLIGFATPLTGFSINHSSSSTIFSVSITVASGTLSLNNLTPRATIVESGTVPSLNAKLATLKYISAAYVPNTGISSRNLNISVTAPPLSLIPAASGSVALTHQTGLAVAVIDPGYASKKSLLIHGSLAGDSMRIAKNGTSYVVSGHGGATTTLAGIDGRIIVYGFAGNDTIDLTSTTLPNLVHGGDGNDIIQSGSMADILYGEGGADLLAGGLGADSIYGGAGRDLLFGGSTKQASAAKSLASSLQLWSTMPAAPTSPQYINLASRFILTRDPDNSDNMKGELDLDIFFALISGAKRDILDRKTNEIAR